MNKIEFLTSVIFDLIERIEYLEHKVEEFDDVLYDVDLDDDDEDCDCDECDALASELDELESQLSTSISDMTFAELCDRIGVRLTK